MAAQRGVLGAADAHVLQGRGVGLGLVASEVELDARGGGGREREGSDGKNANHLEKIGR